MNSAFHELPNDPPSAAGLSFNYAVWTPGTIATFCNVRWNSDYRDVVVFDNQAELDQYIDGESTVLTIDELSYSRPGIPIRVQMPLTRMMRFNYVRVTNPAQPVPGDDEPRSWYYFITDVKHVAPNTTEITVQLDVVQSFIYGMTFGRCYIERGHIGIANEDQMRDYGRAFLTVPEGFDLGGEYQIDRVMRYNAGGTSSVWTSQYRVMFLSTVDIFESGGTIDDPVLKTASGFTIDGLPTGAAMYLAKNGAAFSQFLAEYQDKPWITQGIIGAWAFPIDFDIFTAIGDPIDEEFGPNDKVIEIRLVNSVAKSISFAEMNDWRDAAWAIRHGRYRHLKKFLTYPYSFFEMTTYTGTPVVIKPDSWASDNGEIVGQPHIHPVSMRIAYYPVNYNKGYEASVIWNKGANNTFPVAGEFLDMATVMSNMPSIPVVNDGYLSYMASNRHSIAYQHSSADWSQQRAMEGNRVAFGQATKGMGLDAAQTQLGIHTANAQNTVANEAAVMRAVVGGGTSLVSGAMSGNPAGMALGAGHAAIGGVNAAIDINARNQSLAISNSAARQSLGYRLDTSSYMRDTNRQYADFAAQGDYQNSIAAINAKVQDAKMIQPTTSGQMGGETFIFDAYKWGVDLKYKTLTDSAMVMIGEHWLRYGYAINRYHHIGTHKALHCMDRFTYWKMQECVIRHARMPETFKQAIRGILEKGVTVWQNPDDIGWMDPYFNEPLSDIAMIR